MRMGLFVIFFISVITSVSLTSNSMLEWNKETAKSSILEEYNSSIFEWKYKSNAKCCSYIQHMSEM